MKESFQFRHRPEVKLRIRPAFPVAFLQALAVLDGHQTILQLVPFTDVVVNVAGGCDFDTRFRR